MRGIVTRTLAAVALGAAAWLGGVSPAGASVFDDATPTGSGAGASYGQGGHSCVATTAWGDAWCPGKPLS
ncbi:hypothetical protein ACGF13_30315 [Kitasatospora sp. NPDC048286]|uniref:hypothetical protein n=1 Tax=unclassified Kitasatospora TaxID=2633591 RepID=UPI0037186589